MSQFHLLVAQQHKIEEEDFELDGKLDNKFNQRKSIRKSIKQAQPSVLPLNQLSDEGDKDFQQDEEDSESDDLNRLSEGTDFFKTLITIV